MKATKTDFDKVNFSYFFSVAVLCCFAITLVTALPFYKRQKMSQRQPEVFVAEEAEDLGECIVPPVPTNPTAVSGPESGQVTLIWDQVQRAEYYNITYGPSSLNYKWGAPNVGNVSSFVVSGLQPGYPYYFIVAAVNKCGSSGAIQEVAAYAGEVKKKILNP